MTNLGGGTLSKPFNYKDLDRYFFASASDYSLHRDHDLRNVSPQNGSVIHFTEKIGNPGRFSDEKKLKFDNLTVFRPLRYIQRSGTQTEDKDKKELFRKVRCNQKSHGLYSHALKHAREFEELAEFERGVLENIKNTIFRHFSEKFKNYKVFMVLERCQTTTAGKCLVSCDDIYNHNLYNNNQLDFEEVLNDPQNRSLKLITSSGELNQLLSNDFVLRNTIDNINDKIKRSNKNKNNISKFEEEIHETYLPVSFAYAKLAKAALERAKQGYLNGNSFYDPIDQITVDTDQEYNDDLQTFKYVFDITDYIHQKKYKLIAATTALTETEYKQGPLNAIFQTQTKIISFFLDKNYKHYEQSILSQQTKNITFPEISINELDKIKSMATKEGSNGFSMEVVNNIPLFTQDEKTYYLLKEIHIRGNILKLIREETPPSKNILHFYTTQINNMLLRQRIVSKFGAETPKSNQNTHFFTF